MTSRSLWLGTIIALVALSTVTAQSRRSAESHSYSKQRTRSAGARLAQAEESTVAVEGELVKMSESVYAADAHVGTGGTGCVSCQACPGDCGCGDCCGGCCGGGCAGGCCGCGMKCGCKLGQKKQCVPYPRCFSFHSPCDCNRCCGDPCCKTLLGEMVCDFKSMLDRLKWKGCGGCPTKPFGFGGGCCRNRPSCSCFRLFRNASRNGGT